jgi:hypothetical protein
LKFFENTAVKNLKPFNQSFEDHIIKCGYPPSLLQVYDVSFPLFKISEESDQFLRAAHQHIFDILKLPTGKSRSGHVM